MLSDVRNSKNLSQNQLAKKAGVPQSVISDIESGKTKAPRFDTLRSIAGVLGVTIDELMKGQDDYDEKRNSGLLEE